MDDLIFQSIEPSAEAVERTSKHKAPARRQPLGFAFFGLVLFLVVYFARPEDWIPGLLAVPLAKITGALILLALAFSFNEIHWHIPLEVVFLIFLVAQLWLSAIFSPVWKGGAFNVMLEFSKILPLVIVMYGAVRSMKRLRWILFVQAASVASIAIATITSRKMIGGRLQGVLSGSYGDPNDLAVMIDLALPLCLALALTTRSYWKRLVWTAVMLALIYVVFLTASRTGALALVIVALMCTWKFGVTRRRLSFVLFLPVALVALWLYGGDSLRIRLGQENVNPATRNETEASASAQARRALLIQSIKVTAEHPLFGVGAGNFEVVSGMWHVTHNSYTQMSAEGGIAALVLYVLILWRSVVNLRSVTRHKKARRTIRVFSIALEASLAGFLVGSFFLSLAYNFFPYCLVAYSTALRKIESKDRADSNAVSSSDLIPAQVLD